MLVDRVDAELLDAAGPGLRVVADVVVGYDNVDVAACTERGVVVTNTPGVLTDATADIAMALVLMTTRGLGAAERRVRTGEPWQLELHRRPRHRAAREDPRHRGPGRDRPGHGAAGDGLRHGGPALRALGARPRCRRGAGRAGRRPRRAAHGIRRRLAALPAHPGHAPPHRRRRAAGDEADRAPGQHLPRPGRRRGGPGGRARGGGDRRCRARRLRGRAAGAPRAARPRRRRAAAARRLGDGRDAHRDGRPRRRRTSLAVLAGERAGHPGAAAEPVLARRGDPVRRSSSARVGDRALAGRARGR